MNGFRSRTQFFVSIAFLSLCLGHSAHALPGDLDNNFGQGGFVTAKSTLFSNSSASDIAIQTDGKLVVAGNTSVNGLGVFLVRRFSSTGQPDNSFGFDNISGIAAFGGVVLSDFAFGESSSRAVAIQADGKIVVAGEATSVFPSSVFALARYNKAPGTLDTTFGDRGRVTEGFGSNRAIASDLAIQTDGKIVVVGTMNNSLVTMDFALARYDSSGHLDVTFGTGGKVTTDFGGSEEAGAVAIQRDGKIVVAGGKRNPLPSGSFFAVARYNPNGSLDTTFGSGGKVTTNFVPASGDEEFASDIAIQNDGRIVVVGNARTDTGGDTNDFALARYNSDGSMDFTFGSVGKVITSLIPGDPQTVNEDASAVAIQADGKILAAGDHGIFSARRLALFRYTPNGTLDSTFSGDGRVTSCDRIDCRGPANFRAAAIAIKNSNGRIILAGPAVTLAPFSVDMTLASYHAYECGGRNATIVGTAGQLINGTIGPDVIVATGGNDTIHGGEGDDTICGGDGNDGIFGDNGSDTLVGGLGVDGMHGGNGADICVRTVAAGDRFSSCETISITGVFDLTPTDPTVAVNERLSYAFSWTVPEPLNWHDLLDLQFRIRDDAGTALWLEFDEAGQTFSLFNEETDQFEGDSAPESADVLQSPQASLHLAETRVVASGPTSPTVTLNLSLSFEPPAAGRTFVVEVAASDDEGNQDDFAQAGTLRVNDTSPPEDPVIQPEDPAIQPEEPASPQEVPARGAAACGAGATTLVPLAALGLLGAKRYRRRVS